MTTQSNPDLTASLLFHNADPKEVLLASRYVHGLALKLKRRPGETRTLDQLKVDIALDLLQGKSIDGAPPAPAPIMLIFDELAGRVPGYGSVLPDTIRGLLEDPSNVDVATTGDCTNLTTSRRPTRAQQRHVRRRYPNCIFPGCRMPATQCDLDHRQPWATRPYFMSQPGTAVSPPSHVQTQVEAGAGAGWKPHLDQPARSLLPDRAPTVTVASARARRRPAA